MDQQAPALCVERSDGVATVTIRHPAKRNALTPDMWRELPPTLRRLAEDPEVRVLVLTGEGATFSAGADIRSLREGPDASQTLAVAAEEAVARFPRPTLAAVRGYCVGGGCQLAAACDIRFAADDALFGITPAKLGIVYPASSTERLVRLVGAATAKYLLFSGELIDAGRALREGLAQEVHPAAELSGRVADFARTLARRSALSQTAAKEYIDAHGAGSGGADWQRLATTSGEAAEGVAAFLERRPPRFAWPRRGAHTGAERSAPAPDERPDSG